LIIGLPKGLYYHKYHTFIKKFLTNLDITYITSPDTNKNILNEGIRTCVDEACLPIKIFHGHVSYLKDKCDLILAPRIMKASDGEYICPKFCGLPEMLVHSISILPPITTEPLYLDDSKSIYRWCKKIGKYAQKSSHSIKQSFNDAMITYTKHIHGLDEDEFSYKIALLGHLYSVYDDHVNMGIVQKLHTLDTGVVTEEYVETFHKEEVLKDLIKKPFWTSMSDILGAGVYLSRSKKVDGIIFLSSFQCGIDSVSIDLLKDMIGDFPMLVLKLDEHSGQAGMETRVEAFTDMLKRRQIIDINVSTHG